MPTNFAPRTILENEALVVREQPKRAPFAAGVFNDIPASEVPENGLAYASGYIPRDFGAEAAGGVSLYSSAILPGLTGRTGYSLSKATDVVTKTVGTNFSSIDVGNYVVYDDGKHERITEYLSTTQVRVEVNDAHAASTAAWIRGPVNATALHRGKNKVLLHIDTRLYVADAAISAYTQIPCISYNALSNSKSRIIEERDNAIIVCANGFFKVDLGADTPLYYQINTPNPTTLITSVKKTIEKIYGYKYLYSMSRISGDGDTRDRLSADAVIEHETGTCQYDSSGIDYGQVFNDRLVGDASTTYADMTGLALVTPYDVATGWSGITNGQFRISINGTSYNVSADFSDCKTMADVAARIQGALRAIDSGIIFEYTVDHFVVTNPTEGGTLSYVSAGDGGTDIGSTAMKLESPGASIVNHTYAENIAVGDMVCPVDPIATSIPEYHHTHYTVYKTLDIGDNGIDPISSDGNNEEQFIWAADVPIAKAFVASRTGDLVTSTAGSFQAMDVGSKLRFQDGTEDEIAAYVSSSQVYTLTSGTITSQAAAIGGDNSAGKAIRIMTASQTGTTVTRTAGTTFSTNDVGKPIFWSGGLRSHITAYISANQVTVAESQLIISTGACMDPKCRKFNDTISDDVLRPRITRFSLKHRFWEPLPECDYACLVPGFLFGIVIDGKTMYYSQVVSQMEYLIGSYNPDQYTTFQDKIKAISEFPDLLVIYCSHSWSVVPTNTFQTINVNDVLQYFKISGQWVVDQERGLMDRSFLCKLPDGRDWVITSEPAARICDGKSLSDNFAQDRYMKILEQFQALGSVMYEKINGISIFGEE